MPKSRSRGSKLRTSVLSLPSTSSIMGTRIMTMSATSPLVGSRITHTSQENYVEVSSVLKKAPSSAKVDSIITGTNLSSDLNTPEIRFDDFAFLSDTVKHDDSVNTEEVLFHELENTNNNCSKGGDSLTEASSSIDKYSLLDMSPGIRDTLQGDQLEESMDLNDYTFGLNDSGYAENFDTVPLVYSQTSAITQHQPAVADLFINELGAPNYIKNEIAYSDSHPQLPWSPPQLLISDDDLNFTIPPDILEQMENLLPDPLSGENLLTDASQNATDLDMYLGTHGDMLSEVIEESGILSSDLEQFQFQEDQSSLAINDASSVLPASIQSQEEIVYRQSTSYLSGLTQTPREIDYNTVETLQRIETVEPSSSQVFHTHLPSQTSKPAAASKRHRRSTKKPVRFRDEYAAKEVISEESSDEEVKIKRPRNNKSVIRKQETFILKEEELEVFDTPSSLNNTFENSAKDLTEEEKYHRIRNLNNLASKRCRQKRKASLKQMEKQLDELQEKNENLRRKHDALLKLKERLQPFVYKVIAQGLSVKK
ncbi:hypothetical protein SK128_001494 [Halocaridina rubra]|uniref:BZIP domain-containing protein n=1 Tax=Halocaridina rubra TaxID=373956 RepID=A0AAN8X578_HALRR